MKTKRALIIIGSFLLAVLAGCGQGKQDLTEQQEKPEGSPIVVGFSQVGAESEWRVANTESIKRALSEVSASRQRAGAGQRGWRSLRNPAHLG